MSSENSTLVKLNNAGFKQNDKWLVEGVSLTVEKGKIVTLIGPNGSGKSTTAKIALGIYKNIEGSVEKYTNKVGYVPQKISIDWTLPLRVYNVKSFEDDALYRLEIRKKFREMINLGFNDVYRHFYEDKEGYTFWDYMRGAWQKNNGMRIDHFLVSNSIINQIKDININKDPRGREKPSDHTPIEINLA